MGLEAIHIVGAGGLGKEILGLIIAINRESPRWHVAGFYDDNPKVQGFSGVPVAGSVEDLVNNDNARNVVIAIGNPKVKQSIAQTLSQKEFPTLIHPTATILMPDTVHLAEGVVICAGARLTTSISVGSHSLVNLNATIGHDSSLGAYVSVMPGVNIAGEIHIESGALIGSGSNLINGVKIGEKAIVGAGAVVTHDVLPATTVVGVPARKMDSND